MPLSPQITLQAFNKWEVNFVGPIILLGNRTSVCYIITMEDYLTRWAEAVPIKNCAAMTAAKFMIENVITIFGCPKILLSDQGTHFVNKVIAEQTTKF